MWPAVQNQYMEADDASFRLEADQHGLMALFIFNSVENVWRDKMDLVAVESRFFAKKAAIVESSAFAKKIVPVTLLPGREYSYERFKALAVNEYAYQEISTPYDIVPGLAEPWSWQRLSELQFGIEAQDINKYVFIDETFSVSSLGGVE